MLEIYHLQDLINSPEDRKIYSDLAIKHGDVYYNLEYLNANILCENGKCYVAIFKLNSISIIYPFILREILPELTFGQIDQVYYDLITPYEYGGPLLCASSEIVEFEHEREKFDSEFRNFCIQKNIITETVRFNPILKNHLPWVSDYEVSKVRENIIVDLRLSNESIFNNYHKNKRRDIRSAIRKGVTIYKAVNNDDLAQFEQIYIETMNRNRAKLFYYFSEPYFKALFALSTSNLVSLYLAKNKEGEVIAASFFLLSNHIVHYHLSGSSRAFSNLQPQNLLLHSVNIEMKNQGYNLIHLGGASLSQTGLYKFKSNYSPDRVNYYLGKRIHNVNIYKALCEKWLSINESKEESNDFLDGFFPLYRKSMG